MNSIIQDVSLIERWIMIYGILLLRYSLVAGGFFVIFYLWKKKDLFYKKIQERYPDKKFIVTEIKYSLMTFGVFATFACINFILTQHGYTKIYKDFNLYGTTYFVISLIATIALHDTYFYWTHRLMHHPKIFKYVHKIHHLSHNPTPFASFSFHPFEAIVEFGIIFLIAFLFPVHRLVFLGFSVFMIMNNVMGHLGFELYPKGFTRSKWTFWLNTSTNHNMHHKHINCNYGLYFNIWDRIMKTNHAKYHEVFDEVADRKKKKIVNSPEHEEYALNIKNAS